MQNTCLIIPCYNEGKRLPFEDFNTFLKQNEISFFFVNDGSKDNTKILLEDLKKKFPQKVEVINLNENLGKGEAVRQGFLAAFSTHKFKFIGFVDADLATPLEEIPYLLRYFEPGIKIVMGSRVKRLGATIERNPIRHYFGRIFATMANNYLDIKVYDSQCGAKIFDSLLAKELFSKPMESKWLFDLELLYRFKKQNPLGFYESVVEIPLRSWCEKGNSKIKIKDFVAAPFELIKIKTE